MKAYENILGGVSFFNNFIKSLVEPILIEVGLTDCNFVKKNAFHSEYFLGISGTHIWTITFSYVIIKCNGQDTR